MVNSLFEGAVNSNVSFFNGIEKYILPCFSSCIGIINQLKITSIRFIVTGSHGKFRGENHWFYQCYFSVGQSYWTDAHYMFSICWRRSPRMQYRWCFVTRSNFNTRHQCMDRCLCACLLCLKYHLWLEQIACECVSHPYQLMKYSFTQPMLSSLSNDIDLWVEGRKVPTYLSHSFICHSRLLLNDIHTTTYI